MYSPPLVPTGLPDKAASIAARGSPSRRGGSGNTLVRYVPPQGRKGPPAIDGREVADLLEEEEIEQRTDELGDWEREGDAIQKNFEFEDFTAAIKFVNEVAKLADRYDHHPDIDIRWNRVKLVLSTHSEGGLTARDFDVAGEIEQSIQE
jgi:4a-hydroxytetrahydrobiopterin dehydratase